MQPGEPVCRHAGFEAIEIHRETPDIFASTPQEEAKHACIMGPSGRLIDEKNPDETTRQTIRREIEDIFLGMGYEVYEGDEVTDAWHNFDALTTDAGHPSRSPTDTFYLAEDVPHGRDVAVKVLSPELTSSIDGERFRREIQIAARLSHPNILPAYDSGIANGLLYYVMPFIQGPKRTP